MPDQLQLRGGTTAQHTSFTGASKEVTVDTTKKTAVVHDGSTVGGVPLLREDGSNSALTLGSAGTPSIKFTGDANTGIFSPGADQVAISTNGTSRLHITSGGLVGIGTSTPGNNLQVGGFSGSNGITVGAGSSNYSFIYLADGTSGTEAYRGYLQYNHATDKLELGSAGTLAITVDSSQRVGIGTNGPLATLEVKGTSDSFFTQGLRISRYDNTSQYGMITNGGGLNITVVETAIGTPVMTFNRSTNGTTVTENARFDESGRLLVGTTTQVGNVNGGILQLGSGITFPANPVATTDANTLDGYEEGDWIPVLKFGGANVSMTGTFTGKYVKVGKVVHYSASIMLTAKGSSTGITTIEGLPFTNAGGAGGNVNYSTTIGFLYNGASLTGPTMPRVRISSTIIDVFQNSAAGYATVSEANFNNDSQLQIFGVYFI